MSADAKLAALAAEVAGMRGAIVRMAQAVETLVQVEVRQADHDGRLEDHEARLRKVEETTPGLVEMRVWIVGGYAVLVGAILAAALSGHLVVSIVR